MEFQLHCATWGRAYKNVFAYKICVKIVRIVCSADNLAIFPLDLFLNYQMMEKLCVQRIQDVFDIILSLKLKCMTTSEIFMLYAVTLEYICNIFL